MWWGCQHEELTVDSGRPPAVRNPNLSCQRPQRRRELFSTAATLNGNYWLLRLNPDGSYLA